MTRNIIGVIYRKLYVFKNHDKSTTFVFENRTQKEESTYENLSQDNEDEIISNIESDEQMSIDEDEESYFEKESENLNSHSILNQVREDEFFEVRFFSYFSMIFNQLQLTFSY